MQVYSLLYLSLELRFSSIAQGLVSRAQALVLILTLASEIDIQKFFPQFLILKLNTDMRSTFIPQHLED